MRTTLNIDDRLMREARKLAAQTGATLTHVLESALRQYLRPPAPTGEKFRFDPLVKRGRVIPGVNWDDRDSLYERMEGRG